VLIHHLKHKSSFIVVVLRSLRHGKCVRCGCQTRTLEESSDHWEKALEERSYNVVIQQRLPSW